MNNYYKCMLIGNGGVGKTTFINYHTSGEIEKKHKPTEKIQVHKVVFNTTRGPICFDVWDMHSSQRDAYNYDEYLIGAKCAIIMFDVTSGITFKPVPTWIRDLIRVCDNEDVPIVLCANKIDNISHNTNIDKYKKNQYIYNKMSIKRRINVETPFLYLARKLFNDVNLKFVAMPALMPPNVRIHKLWFEEIKEIFLKAQETALPQNHDDDE